MRAFVSKHLKVIVAVVVTFAVATAVPSLGAGGFDAHNARKIGGHTLSQLSSTTYTRVVDEISHFNRCKYTALIHRAVRVPAAGYLTVSSEIGASRDTSDPDEAILITQIRIDGKPISTPTAVNLENDGIFDETAVNEGVARVKKGPRSVQVMAKECSSGVAFIDTRQLVTQFSPTGSIRR
jgi:hypothetical protein